MVLAAPVAIRRWPADRAVRAAEDLAAAEAAAAAGGGGRGGGGPGGPGGRGGGRGPRDRNGNNAFIGNRARGNTNRITGSLFYTFGNSDLNARPFSVDGLLAPKAAYSQNRFGVSAGGPLFVPHWFSFDKITWFFNYTGNLVHSGVDQASSLPTAAERGGQFHGISALIYDPQSGAPFPNNVIPTARAEPHFARPAVVCSSAEPGGRDYQSGLPADRGESQ